MSDDRPTHSRRELLVLGAATVAASTVVDGCAILKGGASHPGWKPQPGAATDGRLRVPLAELDRVKAGGALQLRPGKPWPDLLVAFDAFGARRVVTAECPHFGCDVDWDRAKAEWTCPCHDSRFAADGARLDGPATEPLRAPATREVDGFLEIDLASLAPST